MKIFCGIFLVLAVLTVSARANLFPVPESKAAIYILGDVVKASKLRFEEQMTLTKALGKVGGIVSKNKRPIANIYRLIPGTKEREIIKVRLKDIEKGKSEDLILQPFDIIEVLPQKKNKKIRGNYSVCSFELMIL